MDIFAELKKMIVDRVFDMMTNKYFVEWYENNFLPCIGGNGQDEQEVKEKLNKLLFLNK